MHAAAEQRRLTGNLIRLGTVAEVDHADARCRVTTGALTTGWVPWLVPRVGTTIEWSAPSVGEQGVVLCPDGDTSGAVFLRGMYSDALPPPAADAAVHLVRYPDGTTLRYDATAHALDAVLCSGGSASITASGGVTINADTTINGNVQVNGDIQATGTATVATDVIGGGISLKSHTHGGVDAGTDSTGAPQ
ncbi:phage baseplate assembly protein V [Thermomonas sp.]|uniref:phage baseplate assembly protein V n=1 Tax=Thermomonas sp. TaxID=1971895 RepID=UPI0035B45D81